jgi:radical SAM protein with 4Fe4S-binding SPASM domain
MCKYWRSPPQSLDRKTLFAVLESAANLGCAKVHLSGGEVTLYPDLDGAISHATKLGLRVNLTTNGILVDRDRARSWIRSGLHSASFSLDAARAKIHDEIRGTTGAFKTTLKGIRALRREIERRRAKTRIRVNCVLMRQNLREVPALVRLAGELGACDVVLMPVDGRDAPRPSADEVRRFNEKRVPEIIELRRKYSMPLNATRLYPFGRTKREILLAVQGKYSFGYYRRHPCFVPYLHTFVSYTGEVFPCCMTRGKTSPLGNVKEKSLAEIFLGSAYEKLRAEMRSQPLSACKRCDQYLEENRLISNALEQDQAVFCHSSSLETSP